MGPLDCAPFHYVQIFSEDAGSQSMLRRFKIVARTRSRGWAYGIERQYSTDLTEPQGKIKK